MVFLLLFSGKNVGAQVDMPINLTISEAVKESSKITMRKNYNSGGGLLEASLTAEKRSGDKCSRTDLWENEGYFKKLKCDDISIPKIKMPQNTIILTIPRYCIKMTRIFTTLEIIF